MPSIRRSLDPFKDRAHPSSRNSPSEFLRSCPSPIALRRPAHLPLGFDPYSRHHSSAATFLRRASQALLRSVLRFSQPLDGFFRSRACGLIPSHSHVQGSSSFRGFSPGAATLPHRKEPSPLPLFHRRSCSRTDFRRFAPTSTCDAPRLRGFDPRQAAFSESGYSPRPKPLPSSNFMLLQVLALSTPVSARAVAVHS
jgi:hypothetical protein